MTVTVTTILDSRPSRLIDAAARAGSQAQREGDRLQNSRNAMADLRNGWEGSASDAASASAERTSISHRKVVDSLLEMQSALNRGGTQMTATQSNVAEIVSKIEPFGFQIADDGTVSVAPGSRADQMASLSPLLARQLQMLALSYSVELKKLIAEFETQDIALANAMQRATSDLDLKGEATKGSRDGKALGEESGRDGLDSQSDNDIAQTDSSTPGMPASLQPPPLASGPAAQTSPQVSTRPAAATASPPSTTSAGGTQAPEIPRPSDSAAASRTSAGPVPPLTGAPQPTRSGPVPAAPRVTSVASSNQGSGPTSTAAAPVSYSAPQSTFATGGPQTSVQAFGIAGDFPEKPIYEVDDDGWVYNVGDPDFDPDTFEDDW